MKQKNLFEKRKKKTKKNFCLLAYYKKKYYRQKPQLKIKQQEANVSLNKVMSC